jgi:hypothetical protein
MQAKASDDPLFADLYNVLDNRLRALQNKHIGASSKRSAALPAPVLYAMFATPAWDITTPLGLQQGLVFLLIRDFILRVHQVYDMTWCVVLPCWFSCAFLVLLCVWFYSMVGLLCSAVPGTDYVVVCAYYVV